MSPEQALGHEVDARSDLYSLGATAFYAFSGRLPFEGRTPTEVLAKQVTQPAPLISSLGLSVPRKVASLIDRCLAKDPAHRPASASALAEQLGVALEQRRELPVALRAFVRRNGRMDGGGTLLLAGGALSGSIIISVYYGGVAGWASLGAGMVLLPFAGMVGSARRLGKLGFAQMDLAPAFRAEIENSREEHALEHAQGPSRLEGILKVTAKITGVGAAIAAAEIVLWALRGDPQNFPQWAGTLWLVAGTVFFTTVIGYLSLLQRRSDVDTGFWSRVWNGRIGRAAWAVAKRLLRGKMVASAITHRATELSLGMAAENLFESLPKETREELGDLPSVLHRLQDDAQALRRHLDELQEALNDAGESATTPAYEPMLRDRDAIQSKLGETVGALETIRLNLLRLHAGSLTVAGLTTHIGLAADVSAEVERMLAAQSEVEKVLRLPREMKATPVGD
jgi:serine/threonine-protein kinase